MTEPTPEWLYVAFAALAALAAFVSLRSLAIYRQQEIAQHDLAREVFRLRAEYESRMRDRKAVEATNARIIR